MNDADFAEVRSALHARDVARLSALLARVTPEYEAYVRDNLDQWDVGTHWDLGLGPHERMLRSMRARDASNPLLASRLLRIHRPDGDLWYERELFFTDATESAARLACDVAHDVMTACEVDDDASWALLRLKRAELDGGSDAASVSRARRDAERRWERVGEGAPRRERARWAAIAASDGVAARALHSSLVTLRWVDPRGPTSEVFWEQNVGRMFQAARSFLGGSIDGAVQDVADTISNVANAVFDVGLDTVNVTPYERRLEAMVFASR